MPFSKESALEHLSQAFRAGRLAHAYLLSGAAASEKSSLAVQLAALVLGCSPEGVAAHPDAHIVQPESKSRRIVISQIRDLEHSIYCKPLLTGNKVAILYDADRMQPQAANAFLKTLEEPPPGSLILLLSAHPRGILETIRSRCIEAPLLDPAEHLASGEEARILEAFEKCLITETRPGIPEAFRFTRTLQEILSTLKDKISAEYEAILRKETSYHKQASGDSSWLEERTAQVKALIEAASLRERDRLLQIVVDTLGAALRAQHGIPSGSSVVNALAAKLSSEALLDQLDALEAVRRRLVFGVQESLALESGFLAMMARSRTSAETSLEEAPESVRD